MIGVYKSFDTFLTPCLASVCAILQDIRMKLTQYTEIIIIAKKAIFTVIMYVELFFDVVGQ